MTTVNGEDDVPVCLDACWEEEFFDNLGQKIKMKKQYCYWKIFIFPLNLEGVYKMLYKWGIGLCTDSHSKQTTFHDFV